MSAAIRIVVLFLLLGCGINAMAQSPQWVRGINLNGPEVIIDGRHWDGDASTRWKCEGQRMENKIIDLQPPLRGDWDSMIRSSRWGRELSIELEDLEPGTYQVVLYVWEDNQSTKFQLEIQGATVESSIESGIAGTWKRLGPFVTETNDGRVRIKATGGDANISGLELWKGDGTLIDSPHINPQNAMSDDQVAFFEKRIRPVLIEHCYACHSQEASELGGGLLLDSAAGWKQRGDSGIPIIVPGSPDRSLLILAIDQKHDAWRMPPEDRLSQEQINDLITWVASGAVDPRTDGNTARRSASDAIDWETARNFWSLQPIARPTPPTVGNAKWYANEIDAFILHSMNTQGLDPSEDAEPRSLLRRASYDLLGLPPAPEAVEAFAADPSQSAYETAIDAMLNSRQYGERWGRHWLDVVRYSDTAGDNSDFPIPQMIRYRDWVIDAIHRDMPYDQFLQEQLAGDLMPSENDEQRYRRVIATGYIANARRFGSRVDDYPQHLTIEDTLDNLGKAFMATTLSCARCHNHKFDPITVEDYYGLYGIFASTRYPWPGIELDQKQRDLIPLTDPVRARAEIEERKEQLHAAEERLRVLEKERDAASEESKKLLETSIEQAKQQVKEIASRPYSFSMAYAVAEGSAKGDARIQNRGDPAKLGPVASRRYLAMLGGAALAQDDPTSGRLALAHWITDPKNPLTARVMVNRIWQHHFGRGLVETANDFGRQGKPPSHPELLDWLASVFIDSGWSMKAMHRKIMTSRTYRLSTHRTPSSLERDPSNLWLSSYPLRRLDAESIRDTLLTLSGKLDPAPGPEHPFPLQSEWKFTQHNPFKAVYESSHRSVYLMTQRIQRHPFLAIFDGPDPAASTALRMSSTTPLQALYFLNSPFFHEQSEALTDRVVAASHSDDERIHQLYMLCLSRPPEPVELATVRESLSRLKAFFASQSVPAPEVPKASWRSVVRSILRLNEFIYLE